MLTGIMNSMPCRLQILSLLLYGSSLIFAGCTGYHPAPLLPRDTSIHDLGQIPLNWRHVALPGLVPHPFDPAKPLDVTSVAMLAVVGNPELKLARGDAGIARAQAFAAGLLPDPQFNLAQDFPGEAGFVSAYNADLAYDLGALVTLSARRKTGAAEIQKSDLALLWQEWRVVLQSRRLFAAVAYLQQGRELLRQAVSLAGVRAESARRAMEEGNATWDGIAPYLVAQNDAQRQLDDLTRQLQQGRFELNALLGLAPEVRLELAPLPPMASFDADAVRAALRDIPMRRPDLLALASGYEAQESRLRAAVLSQFPSLNIGLTRARDTSAVHTSGFTLGITLPVFSGARGSIAVESATRQRLRDEYQSRINASHSEVEQIVENQTLLQAQLRAADDAATALKRMAADAEKAYEARQMTVSTYVDLQSSLLARQSELLALNRAAMEQRITLQSLLGGVLPDDNPDAPAKRGPMKDAK